MIYTNGHDGMIPGWAFRDRKSNVGHMTISLVMRMRSGHHTGRLYRGPVFRSSDAFNIRRFNAAHISTACCEIA